MRAIKYVALIFFSSFVVKLFALRRAVIISLKDPQEFLAKENFSRPNRDS
jgi:hypothetical protein